jgi:2-iminobutanoate/2-iminopropanoate deaminase
MSITRYNPEFGYLDPAGLQAVGVSQLVAANGFIHWSGVVAARSEGGTTEIVSPGDVAGQLAFVLEAIDRSLQRIGSRREQIVSLTMFSIDVPGLSAALVPVFAPWAGENRPTLTCIGVDRLGFDGLLLEVQGIAAV